VDVDDVLLGHSEYSDRIMGLVSFLMHCDASNMVLKMLKHDKMQGKICISVLQILGDTYSPCPVIYAIGYTPE